MDIRICPLMADLIIGKMKRMNSGIPLMRALQAQFARHIPAKNVSFNLDW